MNIKLILFIPIFYLLSLKSHANSIGVSDLKEAIQAYTAAQIVQLYPDTQDFDIKLGYLDKHLTLEPCAHPVEISQRHGQIIHGRMSLDVECRQPKTWRVTVPVQIEIYKTIAITNQFLPRGKLITSDDISFMRHNISSIGEGYFESKDNLIGMEISRTIRQGSIIKPNMIKEPILVRRGNAVKIISLGQNISVQALGIALQDGVKGDTIAVKNRATNLTVEGKVTAPDTITITL